MRLEERPHPSNQAVIFVFLFLASFERSAFPHNPSIHNLRIIFPSIPQVTLNKMFLLISLELFLIAIHNDFIENAPSYSFNRFSHLCSNHYIRQRTKTVFSMFGLQNINLFSNQTFWQIIGSCLNNFLSSKKQPAQGSCISKPILFDRHPFQFKSFL